MSFWPAQAVAGVIETRIKSIDFAELRLAGGHAVLEDAKTDAMAGQIDLLDAGTWHTAISIDSIVSFPVDAAFRATRL